MTDLLTSPPPPSHIYDRVFPIEAKEPMLTGIHHIMSTKEASFHLKNPSTFTSTVEDMDLAASGTVWLYRASLGTAEVSDWRKVGHHFRLTGGSKMTIGKYQNVDRKVAHLVCPDGSTSNEFRRITWNFKDSPRDTLVQFWGNEELIGAHVESDSRN
jgi:hypothetical protein